jgi:citrate lyase subunit beta/citryl-CoA lyase
VTADALPLTWLYAPGDRQDVVGKALGSGADVVLIDLEDAVAPDRKEYARTATADRLRERQPVPVHVRVNALDGPWVKGDLEALSGLPGLSGLRLPKVTSPREVVRVAELTGRAGVRAGAEAQAGAGARAGEGALAGTGAGTGTRVDGGGVALYALLESALGVERAFAIACAHPALRGIALGEADLRADLGVREDRGLDWSRSRVVVAARAAGLPAPVQSVYPDVRDLEGLAASCAHGRALGFLGRTAIHPRQLPVIERAYLPTQKEIVEAEQIARAATATAGAQALPDGRFIDAAVVAVAHRTLTLARRRR